MSLSFGQRQQFFTSKYTSLDEIAQILTNEHGFNYEGEADFISDFAENIWNKKDSRFSIADRKFDAESKRQYDHVVARYKDKIGTFDNANDDIRFSFVETRSQEEIDAINAKFRDLYEQHGFSLDELAINGIDLAESHILLINVNNSFRQKKLEQKYSSLLKFDYITYSTSPNIMRCILGVKIFLLSSSTKLKRFPSFGVLR